MPKHLAQRRTILNRCWMRAYLARAKGGSAQGTVNILTVMTFVMIAFMSRSGAMSDIVKSPLVQVLYALICLVIVYGHSQVSNIIDNAV